MSRSPEATCFCALGAMQRVYDFITGSAVASLVAHNLPMKDTIAFNDNSDHKTVYNLLKKASV